MSEERVVCRECGKEYHRALDFCPECGVQRRRTRATRQALERAPEPPQSQVASVTEAVRTVPKLPPELKREQIVRKRSRRQRPQPTREELLALRRGGRSDGAAERPRKSPRRLDTMEAASAPDSPVAVRRVSRRKIYRYGTTRRKRFKYATEVRAIVLVLVVGTALVLICRAQADASANAVRMPYARAVSERSRCTEDRRPVWGWRAYTRVSLDHRPGMRMGAEGDGVRPGEVSAPPVCGCAAVWPCGPSDGSWGGWCQKVPATRGTPHRRCSATQEGT